MKRLENIRFEEIQGLVENLILSKLETMSHMPREHQRMALVGYCSTNDEVRIVDEILERHYEELDQ